MKIKLHKNTLTLIGLFIFIPVVILTISIISHSQSIKQFAQESFSSPPLYGCLKVGEGSNSDCASKLGITTAYTLTLHDRPVNKQAIVYYGDRIKGSVKFTNIGDLPIELKNIGLAATSENKKDIRDFQPLSKSAKLPPRESITLNNASYRFKSPDPNKDWTVSSKIRTAGGEIPTNDTKQKITVNATCTALRVKELTDKDKSNLKTYCGKNQKSKLCTSRQYCEIFKGSGCTQPNVSEETPGWQCDEGVYLPKQEQDLLEELCKVYPDTDACKNFCDRTVNTSLCPQKYLFIDTNTGKAVRFEHPRAIYVRDPDNFTFEYAANYPAAKTKMSPKPSGAPLSPSGTPPKPSATPQRTLGVQTKANTRLLALAGPGDVPGMNSVPAPQPPKPIPRGGAGAGYVPGQGTSMRPAAPAPARRAAPPPRRSEPMGSQPGDPAVERNNQPPDPARGRFRDPNNPNGSLTVAQTAEFGDFGYNPSCGSGRGDANPRDDAPDVQQFACCASSQALREGCCGGQCTVWSQKSKDGTLRDGAGRVCTNDPEKSRRENTCGRSREDTIPPELTNTGPVNPPTFPGSGFTNPRTQDQPGSVPGSGQLQPGSGPGTQPVVPGTGVVGPNGEPAVVIPGLGQPGQPGGQPVQPGQPIPPVQPPQQPEMTFTQPGVPNYTGRNRCVGPQSREAQIGQCDANCGLFSFGCHDDCVGQYDRKWNECSARFGVPAN